MTDPLPSTCNADEGGVSAEPDPFSVFFNFNDLVKRGVNDPDDDSPWQWAKEWAKLICGASQGSTIDISYYFVRALTLASVNRDETDAEVVYRALQWVHENRDVTIRMILEGANGCPNTGADGVNCSTIITPDIKKQIEQRFVGPDPAHPTIGTIDYCINGCFNRNPNLTSQFAIVHEKFVNMSSTIWAGKPLVLSSSGNLARSQIRNYHQELSVIYGDQELSNQFHYRFEGMLSCAVGHDNCAYLRTGLNKQGLVLQDGIWRDPYARHTTDPDRGTTVTFSPQYKVNGDSSDVYLQQLKNVSCVVDPKIRVAMFKMTDQKATAFAQRLKELTQKGCDVKLMLSSQGGDTVISPTVLSILNQAKVWTACSAVAMHTKMVLIGPSTGANGRVLHGTQNMDISGQYDSEEHVITYDPRSAAPTYQASLRTVYAAYSKEWLDISRSPRDASQANCKALTP